MSRVNTLSGRGPGGPQSLDMAHPVAPAAKYLSRVDPAPRFAWGRSVVRLGVTIGWLVAAAFAGGAVAFAMLGRW